MVKCCYIGDTVCAANGIICIMHWKIDLSLNWYYI